MNDYKVKTIDSNVRTIHCDAIKMIDECVAFIQNDGTIVSVIPARNLIIAELIIN